MTLRKKIFKNFKKTSPAAAAAFAQYKHHASSRLLKFSTIF